MSYIDSPIKFGTDGWRGIIAEDFTFDNVRICAQAVADYLKATKLSSRGLVIGYDTRLDSENFASAAAEVTAANGIKVYLCPKAIPTPVVSYSVLAKKSGGAVIITASHNPAKWNGFKYKTEAGTSASDKITAEIEKHLANTLKSGKVNCTPFSQATDQGMIEYFDPTPLYTEHLTRLFDLKPLRQSKFKIVADSMYGAGIGFFKQLLGGGNIKVTEIHGERNPTFPGLQPEPVAVNLTELSDTVKKEKADIGLATDGDADRIGIVDEKGRFLTPLQVFALLALYLLEVRGERGAIVKTITSTSMLYRLGEIFNVPVFETPVGFKYVAPVMAAENAIIGGEESGGYGFRGHMLERDGILAGIYFLDLMLKTGKSPSQLINYLYSKVGPHHFKRIDVEFTAGERPVIIKRLKDNPPQSINGVKVAKINTADGFHFTLADNSWLLIRFSGTEPLLRIYSESNSLSSVEKLLKSGKKLAGI